MTSPGPYLALKTGSGDRQLSLAGGSYWTVGRGDDNNFVLPDRWISRNHAMLQEADSGRFYLIDLGSRNGTFVNGRRVSVPVILHDGDLLTFGQTELRFFSPEEAAAASDAPMGGVHGQNATATAMLHVRQLISVMVVDIRDFTVLTRQIDEKILSEAIGTWFRRAGEIIGQYGSWVDKYIGDAVMTVWIHGPEGADQASMIKILQAVSTLAEMTSQLHEQFPLPFPLRIGAGINTGYAMVGNTGSGDRPDYTALGDTVNAAFRLESATKSLGLDIAIGETTYKYLQRSGVDDPCFKHFTVELKGYEEPITTHAATFVDLNKFLAEYS
ncbi:MULTISPECIES: adenylate/guanylate cyclase domain-containing protein [Cyanophyceae]|uniref:FHA domain-containing protein n=1 Tax=Cyanophyceae TaxID=3028117 RepID=UPI0016895658|nr:MULTISPECIES: adenylate/guanylate cyclase domain-containing protein [unclassified Phormidium]MBD1915529.1 adenylate/guanylate cyclase domain-containing protein [Phormidium sp. FACHB-77]MBD2031839.1 adenylate/guanylate cyclase domain-containing protein [Phormidium sp. FACHB-322]MBD2050589.1 adenylate/guanylate cyclase domain-containing protein [Leptolyngbya sp. FACHB-60]